jgi:hypothetical protein
VVEIPRFSRAQVVAAFDALGLSDREDISSLEITGTEIEVGVFVPDEHGDAIQMLGELAQVFVRVPVED